MAQVRVRKRGKTFSYIFEAGKVDGKRNKLKTKKFSATVTFTYIVKVTGIFNDNQNF